MCSIAVDGMVRPPHLANVEPDVRVHGFAASRDEFEPRPRFMALALTLGRRGLGNAWPNPAVGAVVVKDGVVVGRGWTQPGGRPHAEVEALRRGGRGGARRHALRNARALLASRQDAALRRRHPGGGHRARRLGAGRPQSEDRRRGPRAAAPAGHRGDDRRRAPRKRGARMRGISAASATAART